MAILTNAINANATTPLLPIQGGSGVSSPTVHGVLVANGASAYSSNVLTNGQLLIGSTGLAPAVATLTAGLGISIVNTAGTITIANTGTEVVWESVAVATAMAINKAYFAAAAGQLTFTLPAVAAVGDTFEVAGSSLNTGGWVIAQLALQSIVVGNTATTVGAGGSITSAASVGNWIEIVCSVADVDFVANIKQGTVTVV